MKKTTFLRGLVTLGAGALLLLGGGGAVASAAQPGGVSGADLAAARQVAAGPDTAAKLSTFFVQLDRRAGVSAQAASAKAPTVAGEPLQVFSLDPKFVAGVPGASPASFAYLAVLTRSASGQQATVWLTREQAGWSATNLTTGTEEVTYPAQAAGGLVFTEPQINAWYRVRDGLVLPLNDPARAQVGAGVPLAGYQKLVHEQYGDKLPGSAYVNQGKFGGYQPAGTVVRPPVPASDTTGGGWLLVLAGAMVALGGIGWAARNRVLSRR
ncbi:hypothetical protein [Amycolatopsis sp. H20-H5]|uniref:hypothetical protein n=1 Tax=Amycolatopsis sp. H20-H5 TaxID=3046309 RepID=UPI002DBB1F4A|nr:hypothetical protein [Amycolatopsis sp. H20-H5]MEC3982743.1 hypothetical protein [Amycolatopsis sp. H20-H5]